MKTTKIIYWVCTIIIVGLMLFSAIGSFIANHDPQAAEMAQKLGYPPYVYKLLGVAKVLGAIAILVPGFKRLKEWAYAGYFFDLFGATLSMAITGFTVPQWAPMIIFIAILFGSYICYHKLNDVKRS